MGIDHRAPIAVKSIKRTVNERPLSPAPRHKRSHELRSELSVFPFTRGNCIYRHVKTDARPSILQTDEWDGPGCGGSLQHLLPSPLHIAKSLHRILKRIGHGLPPCRGEGERVKARIVPHRNVDISLAPAACAAPGVLREDEVYWTANQPKADRGVSDHHT
jgi:hypothetical protein